MGGNKTLYALMRKSLDLYNAPIKAALATSNGKFKQDEPMPELVKKAAEVTSIGVQAGEGWLLTAEILELIEQGCPNMIAAAKKAHNAKFAEAGEPQGFTSAD